MQNLDWAFSIVSPTSSHLSVYSDMIRRGEIPRSCIVPGTGNGKIWKLYRRKIDEWIETR
jgi:hypothetical protein